MSTGIVAFCGTRGLPANYGGFETAVDEITARFLQSGYECDVFCRRSHSQTQPTEYKGRNLIYVEGSKYRNLDTFLSSIQTGVYLLKNRNKYQHVFWFNNANFPGILLNLLAGIPLSVNTDGLEWQRKKWSWPFKLYYFVTSFLLSIVCKRLISDSLSIQTYYLQVFKKRTHYIPYGSPARIRVPLEEQKQILNHFNLESGKFFLQITRIEPDNMPYEIVQRFIQSGLANHGYNYVVIGFNEPTPYAQRLKDLSGKSGVLVLPSIYDPNVLWTLRANSYCYVHGNIVAGTSPALLEAMAACPRVLANDTLFSHEVLGDLGLYFTPTSIISDLQDTLLAPDRSNEMMPAVFCRYQWDAVAAAYQEIIEGNVPVYRPCETDSRPESNEKLVDSVNMSL